MQKKAPFGCLFWIAFILLVFVLFFINKERITASIRGLQESGFFARDDEGTFERSLPPRSREASPLHAGDEAAFELMQEGGLSSAQGLGLGPLEREDLRELVPPPPPEGGATDSAGSLGAAPYGEEPSPSGAGAHVPTRQQRLYFVSIDSEGRVLRQEILKDIPRSDSPLSDALTALFAGPSEQEAQRGIISLIPQGTRLLSAVVRDGIAFVSVSEEFRFNGFGAEGAIAQLAQVVFTATTFPTVSSVQILIEGQQLEYLGAEGVWIGSPLSRKDFSS